MNRPEPHLVSFGKETADTVLNALPHPILMVDKDEEKSRKAWERLPQFHGFSKTTRRRPMVARWMVMCAAVILLAASMPAGFTSALFGGCAASR